MGKYAPSFKQVGGENGDIVETGDGEICIIGEFMPNSKSWSLNSGALLAI